MLNELLLAVAEFRQQGFAPLQQYWTERDIFHNKDVQISSASWQMSGKVKGVNRKGELMLQTERGTEVISAGEISVRSAR